MKEDPRYPYTYAADYIRSLAGYNKDGTKISRSDASHIRSSIAKIIGWDDEALAMKIADHYTKNEESITEKSVNDYFSALPMACWSKRIR